MIGPTSRQSCVQSVIRIFVNLLTLFMRFGRHYADKLIRQLEHIKALILWSMFQIDLQFREDVFANGKSFFRLNI